MTGSETLGVDSPTLCIVDAHLVDADTDRTGGWLTADRDGIVEVGVGTPPTLPEGCELVDAGGRMLTPGLMDMHAHGCGGGAFEAGPEQLQQALVATAARGVTRTMVSLVTASPADLRRQAGDIRRVAGNERPDSPGSSRAGAGILGVHLEGPCISRARAGAHAPELMRHPDAQLVADLIEIFGDQLAMVTLAPELPGAMAAIAELRRHGVVVAVGHTEADYATTRQAFDAGATILTHGFNAMRGIHHRAPGPIGAAIDDPRVSIELILDGVHVVEPVARMLWKSAGERLVLITDAIAAAGIGDGPQRIGELAVTVTDGVARLTGTDTIAGSTLTLADAVRRAVQMGVGPCEAVAAATAAPARALGLQDRHGCLVPGRAADLVLWNDLAVDRVWRDGVEQDGAEQHGAEQAVAR